MKNRFLFPILLASSLTFLARADETSSAPTAKDATPAPEVAEKDLPQVSIGTKAFDAVEVAEMYKRIKEENKRRVESEAPHLNMDHLDIVELAPFEVQAYSLRDTSSLLDILDPQPRRRLQRLADLDPAAAFELQVSRRSEESFFAGESDVTYDPNAGRLAAFDAIKVGKVIAEALKKEETTTSNGETVKSTR